MTTRGRLEDQIVEWIIFLKYFLLLKKLEMTKSKKIDQKPTSSGEKYCVCLLYMILNLTTQII